MLRYLREKQRRERRLGIMLMAFNIVAFAALFGAAYEIDKAHGITPCQSLANWGMHVCR